MKSIIRKLVPRGAINYRWIKFFSRSAFLSSLYYLLFSKDFYREHHSVLQGKIAYENSLRRVKESSYLLRRNIHRLEKGLIMKPRRPIFALDYINETICCYEKAVKDNVICADEIKWATDVLDEYFRVVTKNSNVTALRMRFVEISQILSTETENKPAFVPYPAKKLPRLEVSKEALQALYMRRRSTRWFKQHSVSITDIMKAIDMASTAPSACNRQPYLFKICNKPHIAQNIAKLAMGTSGFLENIPALIVVVGDLSAYPFERDRHCIYIDASLASMQFMLAAETLGLATCPINWPDIEGREASMQKVLKLPGYLRPVMLIAVGYADENGGIPYSQKKSSAILAEVIDE